MFPLKNLARKGLILCVWHIEVQVAVQCWYNAVNFLPNPHNRHPTACPWGWAMGCLLWVKTLWCSASVSEVPYVISCYRQISNTRGALMGNEIVDHSYVVGASPGCSNYIFILDLTYGLNIMNTGNCKTRREAFKFWDLVCLILEIWQYIGMHYNNTQVYFVQTKSCLAGKNKIGNLDSYFVICGLL